MSAAHQVVDVQQLLLMFIVIYMIITNSSSFTGYVLQEQANVTKDKEREREKSYTQ